MLFNVNQPTGGVWGTKWLYGTARLPMEIPSSVAAVQAQFEDLPNDSVSPSFDIGAGSTY